MHAIFLATASHLRHLEPHDSRHSRMVLEQLSQALPSFRMTLSNPPRNQPGCGDALMACSMLLMQYSWEFSPVLMEDARVEDDGWDTLLGLYAGVRSIIFEFWDIKNGGSRFTSFLTYSPKINIEQCLANAAIPPDIQACFGHCLSCPQISNGDPKSLNHCISAAWRLIPIWRALKLGSRTLKESGLLLDVARYLFTWPANLSHEFVEFLKQNDARCQVILLCYFAAICKLRCERIWWMQDRAVYMFETLFQCLKDKCDECIGLATEMFDMGDYNVC